MFRIIIENYLKLFFILTPFFILSTFLSLTSKWTKHDRKALAVKVTIAITITTVILLIAGNAIFKLFGITVDSFRVGAGILLLLSSINLVKGNIETPNTETEDIAVVPLAIPVAVGPATVGTLLVMGAEITKYSEKILLFISLILSIVSLGILLYISNIIEKLLKQKGLNILIKLTGLILSAMSAQMILVGVANFLK
ncbi:multiple antibiotic resistance protein [Hypnocyclicus thermotrophus]|uniref:UPF0056 membrane protein n=1 Tax=Hypnocyclicus thermotrophus TaxID=1627895 RepID=A0AA46DXJ4_9FUSO|nr:MarC family protein [Hypnocyclicus thermotrophus]TDT68067.1 multiple antibiotic resistance protein [Hypnocyclicus thermotrophus]